MTDLPPEPSDALPETEATSIAEDDFDWQDFLSDYFGEKPADEPPDGAEGQPADAEETPVLDGDSPPVEDRQPEPEPEPTQPQFIEVAGRQIPVANAAQVAELYEFIQASPREAAAFLDVLEGKAKVVPASPPEPEAPPEYTPPADEDWEFVPDTLRQKAATVDELAEKVNQFEAYLAQQQQAEVEAQARQAMAAVEQGATAFREQYDVTDADLEALRQEAASLGIAGTLAERYNGDSVRAVKEALEIAYLKNPEFRERELERRAAQAQQDQKRQQKLGALNGSGGSAPRTEPGPSTADQRQASIVDAVRAAMQSG